MQGYFEMAKAYHAKMIEYKLIPETSENSLSSFDSLVWSSLPYSRLDSAKAEMTLMRLLGTYPYVSKGSKNPYLDTLDRQSFVAKMGYIRNQDSARIQLLGTYIIANDFQAFSREMNVLMSYWPAQEQPYQSAIAYLKEKNLYEKTKDIIESLINQQPQSTSKRKMLGHLQTESAQFDSAIASFSAALEISKADISIYDHRGYAYLMLEKYREAIADYDQVIIHQPHNWEIYHQRGVARFELKDYKGTISDFDQVIETGGSVDALSFLIRGYARYGNGDKKGACSDWAIAAKRGSEDAQQLTIKFCN
jgi:tetratricopeptide (TPR) repeat protein